MKILNTSQIVDPGVQQPFTGPSLQFVEDSYKEILNAIARIGIADATKVTILYGCINSTPGTTTFTLSAGAIYYNGEVYLVPAATLTTSGNFVVANLVDTNTLGDQTFSDGVARTTSHDRTAVWALGASGSGTISGTSASDYVNCLGGWHIVGQTGEPAFTNSWTGIGNVRFKRDGKFVVLSGFLNVTGASNTIAFTLPAEYRPVDVQQFLRPADSVLATHLANIIIASGGSVTVLFTAGSTDIPLDGIRFPID